MRPEFYKKVVVKHKKDFRESERSKSPESQ